MALHLIIFLLLLLLHLHLPNHLVTSVDNANFDALVLVNFRDSLDNNAALSQWNASNPPCDDNGGRDGGSSHWPGVLCDQGRIWGLKLENMGLSGMIDVESLSKLESLRVVSLMSNNFHDTVPDFSRLSSLKRVYLSNNGFSGEIPDDAFAGMASLKKLHLAGNRLSGMIPPALTTLPRLDDLRLERNQFQGQIPNFPPDRLIVFNVSHNQLAGEIPHSLRRYDVSSFSGNKGLCGAPLHSCPKRSPAQSTAATMVAAILVGAAVVALISVVIILLHRKKNPPDPNQAATGPKPPADCRQSTTDIEQGQHSPPRRSTSSSSLGSNKQVVRLTFLRDDVEQFDMTDLLKASAEVLGSGVFGSTYKASMNRGNPMVVKRFKYMNNVGRQEFTEHMRRLGGLNHENVLPIVAFYYRREEKLLVTRYIENFSLAVQLHGNPSRGRPSPDWRTRLRIVTGIANGLQYLYSALPSLTTPHGHLKSSNVLLDAAFNPLLTDYGLNPVMNQEHAPEHMISYKSPEYKESHRISRKTDVWCFGILILETLTGRFPSNLFQQGSGSDVDLATWADSVIRSGGESSAEVLFDKEMEWTTNCREELVKLLRVGLDCCQTEVDKRPDIKQVVDRIHEIKQNDSRKGDSS